VVVEGVRRVLPMAVGLLASACLAWTAAETKVPHHLVERADAAGWPDSAYNRDNPVGYAADRQALDRLWSEFAFAYTDGLRMAGTPEDAWRDVPAPHVDFARHVAVAASAQCRSTAWSATGTACS